MVLAGGVSKRFGEDKGLIELARKPLILHLIDRVSKIVNEKVVVVGSEVQKRKFISVLKNRARVVVDEFKTRSPLVGALTGFKHAQSEYSLLLPCDTPFISLDIVSLLLDLCIKKNAVIPRWPNGFIEPLQAAYRTKSAFEASKTSFEEKKLDLHSMIAHLHGVQYVSTLTLRQLDPKLQTFLNVNTMKDLKKAESMLKSRNPRTF